MTKSGKSEQDQAGLTLHIYTFPKSKSFQTQLTMNQNELKNLSKILLKS